MPIQIIDNFDLNAPRPIDNRFVVGPTSFYTHRDLIPYKYPGMRIWDLNDSIPYVWTGTTYSSENSVSVTGTGTPTRIPKLTLSNVIGDSLITDSGTNVGIGFSLASSATEKLHVNGNIKSDGGTGFIGFGGSITNLNASNITSGTMSLARLTNTSAGRILMSGGSPGPSTSPQWVNSSNVTVGTASNLSTTDDVSSATTQYISFFPSTIGGTAKISSTKLQFVPQTGNMFVSGSLGLGVSAGAFKLNVNGSVNIGSNATVTGTLTTNSIVVGTQVQKATIQYTTPSARTLTIPTLTGNSTFAFLQQAQTFTAIQTFSSQVIISSGTVGAPSIGFSGDTDTGIFRVSSNVIAISTGGLKRLQIQQGSASDYLLWAPNQTNWAGISVYDGGYTVWTRAGGGANAELVFENHSLVRNDDGPMGGLGAYQNSSDLRLKENIDYNFTYGLETIENLKPVKFDYIKNSSSTNKNNLGFIAQDLIDVVPEMVTPYGEDGILSIQSDFLIPILVNSIKQLNQRLKDLEEN
jgi:hypothetical protein